MYIKRICLYFNNFLIVVTELNKVPLIPAATLLPDILSKEKNPTMRKCSILCITVAVLLNTGCKKGTLSTKGFSGIYLEQYFTDSNLPLNLIGNNKALSPGVSLTNNTGHPPPTPSTCKQILPGSILLTPPTMATSLIISTTCQCSRDPQTGTLPLPSRVALC